MAITPGITLKNIIPAYVYRQYSDDADIQAFFAAFNTMAQPYLNFMNNINLPVYTQSQINGTLLDWVGQGLYDIARPYIPLGNQFIEGPLNTYTYNTIEFNQRKVLDARQFTIANDDIYKRILTWHHYRGDGRQFTIPWLKKRVARWLYGVNGTDSGLAGYQNISIKSVDGVFTITVTLDATTTPIFPLFSACISGGILELPFQYTFSVVSS